MAEPGVSFENVWKKFRRGVLHDSLRDLVPALARRIVGRGEAQAALRDNEFWAVRNVSFTVVPGETLGVMGPNGAGKSTILKLLTGIMRPNRGRAAVHGRAGALIEIAAGFHPDLTGRENVYLQGAIMGMRRSEIALQFDEIVEFAELSEAIDTQVKRYSSGMNARLGFAIAAHLDPEVLIIDEVLAVGDRSFQRKAFGRIHEIAARDIPTVIVSHQLERLGTLCSKAILLDRGRVLHAGPAAECINRYVNDWQKADRSRSNHGLHVERISLEPDLPVSTGAPVRVRLAGRSAGAGDAQSLLLRVRRLDGGEPIFWVDTQSAGVELPRSGRFDLEVELAANLAGGMYLVEVCTWDEAVRREVSGTLRTALRVREDHDFHGTVNLSPRFAFHPVEGLLGA
jgi:lipopolysaccharide transport system ATP-binding protein